MLLLLFYTDPDTSDPKGKKLKLKTTAGVSEGLQQNGRNSTPTSHIIIICFPRRA
jgi:hypothetical protein